MAARVSFVLSIHCCLSICDIASLREMTCAGFSMLLFLCLLHLTTPVCKVRFSVEFQESSLIQKIIFSVLNQILPRRLDDSTDFFEPVKSVHRDLNLISYGF